MNNETLLFERRQKVLGNSPLFYDKPLYVTKAEGVYLYSSDSRRYLDCYNNIPIVGHCNPYVVDAIAAQSRIANIHSRYLSESIVNYSERLLSTFKNEFDQILFTCTGSEANEQALRIARMGNRGRGIICSNFAYHGNTVAVDQVSPLFHLVPQVFSEVRTIPFPELYRPLDGLSGAELVRRYIDKVQEAIASFDAAGVGFAGMILCSIFANEGLPNIPHGLLRQISETVRRAGGIVIADEVQAGFGRTGEMWGHELMDFTPDIVTIGKPMGNGYPIGGLVSRGEILDSFRNKAMYFNTFAGGPVAAAAGNAVLDVIQDDNLMANAAITGDFVRQAIDEMRGRFPFIGDIRGYGLWVGVELVRDQIDKTPATEETKFLVNALKDHGVLVSRMGPYGNVLKIRPPLVFNQDNASELLDALYKSFIATEQMPCVQNGRVKSAALSDMSGVAKVVSRNP